MHDKVLWDVHNWMSICDFPNEDSILAARGGKREGGIFNLWRLKGDGNEVPYLRSGPPEVVHPPVKIAPKTGN